MQLKRFFEFNKSDLEPVNSFEIKRTLDKKVWTSDNKIDQDIRKDLMKISKEFYKSLELDAKIEDVILTGSLANYNWDKKFSDFDLHILIDFKKVNKDVELVKKLVDNARSVWNDRHDIKIKGYDVEVYIQDVNEPHVSTGIYSLKINKWIVEPKEKEVEIDKDEILKVAKPIMKAIDKLQSSKKDYDAFSKDLKKTWDQIKNERKKGLKQGEFGTGNLVFKLLRRNGYIEKIIDMKIKSYDKQFK